MPAVFSSMASITLYFCSVLWTIPSTWSFRWPTWFSSGAALSLSSLLTFKFGDCVGFIKNFQKSVYILSSHYIFIKSLVCFSIDSASIKPMSSTCSSFCVHFIDLLFFCPIQARQCGFLHQEMMQVQLLGLSGDGDWTSSVRHACFFLLKWDSSE